MKPEFQYSIKLPLFHDHNNIQLIVMLQLHHCSVIVFSWRPMKFVVWHIRHMSHLVKINTQFTNFLVCGWRKENSTRLWYLSAHNGTWAWDTSNWHSHSFNDWMTVLQIWKNLRQLCECKHECSIGWVYKLFGWAACCSGHLTMHLLAAIVMWQCPDLCWNTCDVCLMQRLISSATDCRHSFHSWSSCDTTRKLDSAWRSTTSFRRVSCWSPSPTHSDRKTRTCPVWYRSVMRSSLRWFCATNHSTEPAHHNGHFRCYSSLLHVCCFSMLNRLYQWP